jgi:hypothetical protein
MRKTKITVTEASRNFADCGHVFVNGVQVLRQWCEGMIRRVVK